MVGTYLMDCTMMMMMTMMMAMAMMREHILFDFLLLFRFLFVTCLEFADGNFCTRSFHNENTTMNMTALATNVQFCCYSFNVCSVFFSYASHLYSSLSSNLVFVSLFIFFIALVFAFCVSHCEKRLEFKHQAFQTNKNTYTSTHSLCRYSPRNSFSAHHNSQPLPTLSYLFFPIFSPLYLLRVCYEQWIFSGFFLWFSFSFSA